MRWLKAVSQFGDDPVGMLNTCIAAVVSAATAMVLWGVGVTAPYATTSSGSHATRRWREMHSNPRSPVGRDRTSGANVRILRKKSGAAG